MQLFFIKILEGCNCFSLLYELSILEKILKVFSYFNLNIANFELLVFNKRKSEKDERNGRTYLL